MSDYYHISNSISSKSQLFCLASNSSASPPPRLAVGVPIRGDVSITTVSGLIYAVFIVAFLLSYLITTFLPFTIYTPAGRPSVESLPFFTICPLMQ